MKTVRTAGMPYIRVYSEPRKKTGYRTKVYMMTENKKKAEQLVSLIKKMVPYGLTTKVEEAIGINQLYYLGKTVYNVIVTPINKVNV